MDNSTDSSTSSGSENSTSGSGEVNATATDYWYSHYEEFTIDSSSTNEISTAGQLAYLAYMVNTGTTYSGYVFQLTADLDMSAYYWVPIGGHEYDCSDTNTSYYFSGEFDGNGHTISGLDMSYADTSSSTYNYMGLFGYVYGTIYGVGIVDSIIVGRSNVGAVVGCMSGYKALVSKCYNTCNITGYSYVGGIAGYVFQGSLYYCYNTGSVTGDSYVGGIVGYCSWSTKISNCYNTGSMSVTSNYVGGIVGFFSAGEGMSYLYNCYNSSPVTGDTYVGGIAGRSDTHCVIINNFNLGAVSGSSYFGGIVGNNAKSSTVIDEESASKLGFYCCYYGGNCEEIGGINEADSSGVAEYLEDIETLAKTTSWYSNASYWHSRYKWNFSSLWCINASQNDGYPVFGTSVTIEAFYDSDEGYWYFEDGYMPQDYVGTSVPDGVDESAASGAYTIRLTSSSFAQVLVYAGTDADYALVTIGDLSGWFELQPIRWIVCYGSTLDTSVTTAVTEQVVTAGFIYSNAGTSFSWAMSSVLGMSVETLEASLELTNAAVGEFSYDSFSGTLAQLAVNEDSTTLESKIAVSSTDELDALGGSYASTCTDFVAFLMSDGSNTIGGATEEYWTRDLVADLGTSSSYYTSTQNAYSYNGALNNGVYVTASGTLNNAKLSNRLGARLTMNLIVQEVTNTTLEIYADSEAIKGYSIKMGYFPQSKISDVSGLTDVTETLAYGENCYVEVDGSYYLCEEIVWDVIAYYNDSGTAVYDFAGTDLTTLSSDTQVIVLSRYVLATMAFNESGEWLWGEGGTMYDWLNGEFYENAFSDSEKAKIWGYDDSESSGGAYDTTGEYYFSTSTISVTWANVWLMSVTEFLQCFDVIDCEDGTYAVDADFPKSGTGYSPSYDCICFRSAGGEEGTVSCLWDCVIGDASDECFGYSDCYESYNVLPAMLISL